MRKLLGAMTTLAVVLVVAATLTSPESSRIAVGDAPPTVSSASATSTTVTDEKAGYSIACTAEWRLGISNVDKSLEFSQRIDLVGPTDERVTVLAWPKPIDQEMKSWIVQNGGQYGEDDVEAVISGCEARIVSSSTCPYPVVYTYINALDRMLLVLYSENSGYDADSLESYRSILKTISIAKMAEVGAAREETESDEYVIPKLDRLQVSPVRDCVYASRSEGCCGYPEIPRWQCSKEVSTGEHWGNCTYWASYMRRDIGDTIADIAPSGQGNAYTWDDWAREAGCEVDRDPRPGDIMVMDIEPGWPSGHVAYVVNRSVDKSTVNVSEMNWCNYCEEDSRYNPWDASDKWFIHSCGCKPCPDGKPNTGAVADFDCDGQAGGLTDFAGPAYEGWGGWLDQYRRQLYEQETIPDDEKFGDFNCDGRVSIDDLSVWWEAHY